MDTTGNTIVATKPLHDTFYTPPWGYFDLASNEYVLKTPFAPRPWRNILWNKAYNAQPTQVTGGISYQRDSSGETVLVNWTGEKFFYLQNLQTGELFNPGYYPINDDSFTAYEHRYGLNTSKTRITQFDLEVKITHSVDNDAPQEYFQVSLTNHRTSVQVWRLVFFNELNLQSENTKFKAMNQFESSCSSDRQRLVVSNLKAKAGTHTAFLECSRPLQGNTCNLHDFTGTYGTVARPDALLKQWPEEDSPIESPVLCGYVDCELGPLDSDALVFTLGINSSPADDSTAVAAITEATVEASKEAQRAELQELYEKLEIKTPDESLDLFTNTWVKHQLNYCAHWNRGWGKGFRDNNQDAWAYTLLDPAYAKKMILDSLPYQFADGRTVRSWAPVNRDAYNDGGTWLIFATHAYLAETGDFAVLDTQAPFFESSETGSLYDHLVRGVDYLWHNRGDRGLCLMPFGDWNDRLTGIGKDGKGQSVWTTMALTGALRHMASIARRTGRSEDAGQFTGRIKELVDALREHAWNGQWYSRAFNDAGAPVGAPQCSEGSIYLLPQAWSIIAGVATDEQMPELIAAVQSKLQTVHGFRLLTPPYQTYDPDIGYLSMTKPGCLENGGNYCHGTMFMAYALCMAGERAKALEALKSIFPINPDNPPAVSREEPFSLTNSYASPEAGARFGRAHFSWRSGTAGWALRSIIEGIMGVKARLDGLAVAGELPSPEWTHASLKRTMRGKVLTICWKKTGSESRTLNGIPVPDAPLNPDNWPERANELVITF